MNKSKYILFGSIAFVLVGYIVWTTVRISRLESRLAQLEASHQALARSTYDFGMAFVRTEPFHGVSGKDLARVALQEMQFDELTACDQQQQSSLGGAWGAKVAPQLRR